MKTQVYNKDFKTAEEIDLNPEIFEVAVDPSLVQEALRIQRANSRQVSANTKTRGEVSGGGKKPWKQKGTGNARAGSTRSPIWRHGGITFGPRANRNFELKMNKKQWRKALYMVLSDKAANNSFLVFSEISLNEPKTKEAAALIKNIQSNVAKNGRKFLFVLPQKDEKVEQAARNLPNAKVIHANSLNIEDLLKYDSVIAPKNSVAVIEKTYLKK